TSSKSTLSLPAIPSKSFAETFLFGRMRIPPPFTLISSSIPALMPSCLRTLDGITTLPFFSTTVVTLNVTHRGTPFLPHKPFVPHCCISRTALSQPYTQGFIFRTTVLECFNRVEMMERYCLE